VEQGKGRNGKSKSVINRQQNLKQTFESRKLQQNVQQGQVAKFHQHCGVQYSIQNYDLVLVLQLLVLIISANTYFKKCQHQIIEKLKTYKL